MISSGLCFLLFLSLIASLNIAACNKNLLGYYDPNNGNSKDGKNSFHDHGSDSMAVWWMSQLRQTPLRMTKVAAATETEEPEINNNLVVADDGGGSRRPKFLLSFPNETKTVWVDVGVNKRTDFLPDLDRDDSLFVLGFEPSHLWKPCEHKHCVVFWAACTPDYDVVELNVMGGGDLCDSLLKPNTNTTSKLWRGCVTQLTEKKKGMLQTVQVPGIPLRALVERIPPNIEIEYIKIDAQGFDLEVMKGALGVSPRGRIQVVSLETMDVDDDSKLLYRGQPRFSYVRRFLEEAGWIYIRSVSNHGVAGEVNAFFVSEQKYAEKVEHLAEVLMSNKEGRGN